MLRALILVMALLASPLWAAPVTDTATGLIFPGGSNQWLRVAYREHEPRELYGVSYAYMREGMTHGTLTCYVYNLGLGDIPDGADSERVRLEMQNSFQGVPQVWVQQGAAVAELWPVSAVRTKADNRLFAYLGAHIIGHNGEANISLTVLTAYHGQFLKLRYTFPGNDLQAAIDDLTGFVYHLYQANGRDMPELTLTKEPMTIAGQRNVAISFDDRRLPGTKAGKVWIAYGVMRLKYREDNQIPLPAVGDVRPGFAEEVFARSQAVKVYLDLKGSDPGWTDGYWEALRTVEAAGYMAAYVWTHHHRHDWPHSEKPAELAKFRKWQKKKLKKHLPESHVILQMQESPAAQSPAK